MSFYRRVVRLIADDGEGGSDDESDGTFWDAVNFLRSLFTPIYTARRKKLFAAGR